VLVRAGAPESPEGSVYGTAAYKYERALRAGATACLLLTGASESDPAWGAAVARFTARQVQGIGPDDPVPAAVNVFGIVSLEAEGRLRSALAAGASPKVTFDVETDVTFIEDPNVIGRVTGAVNPEQSVVVLANWDAGGHSDPVPEGGGAEQNATGVAVALTLASELGRWHRERRRPRRSIVFVFTAGGSLGTVGAMEYMREGIPMKSNVAAVVVLDGFVLQDRNARLHAVGSERTSLEPLLQASFGSRLVREPAGSALDPPERREFDRAGLVTVAFTRRGENTDPSDAPFSSTAELYDLAVDTRRLLDFVWSLADDSAAPVRVEPHAPTPAHSPEPHPL
jgi:aminopeptidase